MINLSALKMMLNDLGEDEFVLFFSNEHELCLFNKKEHEYLFLGNLAHAWDVDLYIVNRSTNYRHVIDISCITHYKIMPSRGNIS